MSRPGHGVEAGYGLVRACACHCLVTPVSRDSVGTRVFAADNRVAGSRYDRVVVAQAVVATAIERVGMVAIRAPFDGAIDGAFRRPKCNRVVDAALDRVIRPTDNCVVGSSGDRVVVTADYGVPGAARDRVVAAANDGVVVSALYRVIVQCEL